MTVAQARALAGGACAVLENDEAEERRALGALGEWAHRFSPVVEAVPPVFDGETCDGTWGLALDVTGCEGVFRGLHRHVNAVANSLEWLGFSVRVCAAPTVLGAHAVARYGPLDRCVVRGERLEEALDPLPFSSLRLDGETVAGLSEIGVETVGGARRLDRGSLPARFGGHVLGRLDRAFGMVEDFLTPIRWAKSPSVERRFDGPVRDVEAVGVVVRELLGAVCDRLREREEGALRVGVVLSRSDAAPVGFELPLSGPSREAEHLWRLAWPHVERANLGFGVEGVSVVARRVEVLGQEQSVRWVGSGRSGADAERGMAELADGLAADFGGERVLRVARTDSHHPGRAYRLLSASGVGGGSGGGVSVGSGALGVLRPTALLARSERVDVIATTPDGPPRWIRWRGDEHVVEEALGPERLTESWWEDERLGWGSSGLGDDPVGGVRTGDFFRVRLGSGLWLWVCRVVAASGEVSDRWVVRGVWA